MPIRLVPPDDPLFSQPLVVGPVVRPGRDEPGAEGGQEEPEGGEEEGE